MTPEEAVLARVVTVLEDLVIPDAILSKLEWARRSGDSERQIRDAAGIVELNPGIDRGYLDQWAHQLGVADLWERIARPG